MNLKSTIYLAAIEAAKTVPLDLNEHALDTAALESFNAAGFDKADYPFWLQIFGRVRGELMQTAQGQAPSQIIAIEAAKAAQAKAIADAAKPAAK